MAVHIDDQGSNFLQLGAGQVCGFGIGGSGSDCDGSGNEGCSQEIFHLAGTFLFEVVE